MDCMPRLYQSFCYCLLYNIILFKLANQQIRRTVIHAEKYLEFNLFLFFVELQLHPNFNTVILHYFSIGIPFCSMRARERPLGAYLVLPLVTLDLMMCL
jgi:hypothetical protein